MPTTSGPRLHHTTAIRRILAAQYTQVAKALLKISSIITIHNVTLPRVLAPHCLLALVYSSSSRLLSIFLHGRPTVITTSIITCAHVKF